MAPSVYRAQYNRSKVAGHCVRPKNKNVRPMCVNVSPLTVGYYETAIISEGIYNIPDSMYHL